MDRPDIEGTIRRCEVEPDWWPDLLAMARWALEVEGERDEARDLLSHAKADLEPRLYAAELERDTLQAAVEAVEGRIRQIVEQAKKEAGPRFWEENVTTEHCEEWADALAAARKGEVA
jgi:hypothetical protein